MSAMFHIRVGVETRSKGGSAARRLAYQRCAKTEDRFGREIDYSDKAEEVVFEKHTTPQGSPEWAQNPDEFWKRVEEAETRINSQIARTLDISIPRELIENAESRGDTQAAQRLAAEEAARNFIDNQLADFIQLGMVATYSVAIEKSSDGGLNWHAHAMLSMRKLEDDGSGFQPKKASRDWNELFANFQQKPGKQRTERLQAMRAVMADTMNETLAAAGVQVRVDSRAYHDRPESDPIIDLIGKAPFVPKHIWKSYERRKDTAMKRGEQPPKPPKSIQRYQTWRKKRDAVRTAINAGKDPRAIIEVIRKATEKKDALERRRTEETPRRNTAPDIATRSTSRDPGQIRTDGYSSSSAPKLYDAGRPLQHTSGRFKTDDGRGQISDASNSRQTRTDRDGIDRNRGTESVTTNSDYRRLEQKYGSPERLHQSLRSLTHEGLGRRAMKERPGPNISALGPGGWAPEAPVPLDPGAPDLLKKIAQQNSYLSRRP